MRQAVRFWGRHPGHAAWLVASLGTATGLVTAVLATANAVLWRPLPVRAPADLVRVYVEGSFGDGRIAAQQYALWKERQDALEAVGSYQHDVPLYLDRGDRQRFDAVHVTTNLFEVLGVTPIVGRTFNAADTPVGAPEVALLSERVWRRVFDADTAIVGRQILLTDLASVQPATVIGVVPDGLDIQTYFGDGVDIYRPVTDGVAGPGFGTYRIGDRYVIGRLSAHRDVAAAERRLWSLTLDTASELGLRSKFTGLRLIPLHEELYGAGRPFVTLLFAAAGLALLVALANASGVVMALESTRTRERALRAALGASKRQLFAQAGIEASLLGAAASLLAIVTASWSLQMLIALAPGELRRIDSAALGWLGLVAAAVIAGGSAATLAIAPLLRRRSPGLSMALSSSATTTLSRHALFARRVLLAAQSAIVLALVASTALTVSTFVRLVRQPLGFSDANVLVATFHLPRAYGYDTARMRTLLDDLRRQVLVAPGARKVALAYQLPLTPRAGWALARLPNGERLIVTDNRVSDGYFGVLGIPILVGSDFSGSSAPGVLEVAVNQAFAERHLGGTARAIAQTLQIGGVGPYRVIGVVGNVREQSLTMPIEPVLYTSVTDRTPVRLQLLTHEQGTSSGAAAIVDAFRRIDPSIPVTVSPLSDRRRADLAATTLQTVLIGGLAAFTLALAAMGIYALVAQFGADRARELGIRTALGAPTSSLVGLLMRTVLASTGAGVLCGLLLTWTTVRLMQRFLFETNVFDPGLWLAALVTFVGVSALAAWLPARHAAKVDPSALLRGE